MSPDQISPGLESGRKVSSRPATGPDPGLAVETRDLTREYRSHWTLRVVTGLERLNLSVRRGEVIGLLGPNGAGKTTTLKLLTGLLKPTSGRAWLLGRSTEDVESRRRLGFLPEHPYFYEYLSGLEYLELAGGLSGLPAREASQCAKRWLGRVGLGDRPRLILRKYSKGMLQRLGLAAALVHDPELLILDEPMSGLDPFGRRDVRELIEEQRERGTTVLFSSHILPDVERLCDRVAIMLRGRLQRVATVAELLAEGSRGVTIQCATRPVLEIPAPWSAVLTRHERPEGSEFVLTDCAQLDAVLAWLVNARIPVRAVSPQNAHLEEQFMAAAAAEGSGSGPDAPRERRETRGWRSA
jgi:ABC-2 type transport system ATP-binding protein